MIRDIECIFACAHSQTKFDPFISRAPPQGPSDTYTFPLSPTSKI